MRRIMISAMSSGSGKTVITTAFLLAMKRRGLNLISFKCGPDYIDPMYHTRVLGIPCRNLDLFLMGRKKVAEELSGDRMPAVSADRASADDESNDFGDRNHAEGISCDLAVIEGAMGFYDGIGGTARASAYEIASQTTTPVILVVRSKGQSATLAAQLLGMMKFREKNCLAGVIFTECTEGLYAHLKPIVERETGLSVFGYLPKMEEAAIESRHLGLVTAEEIAEFEDRFAKVADQLEKTVDLDGVLRIAEEFQAASSEKSAASARYQSERQIRAAFSERSAVFASSQVDAQFQSAATEESTVPAKTSGTKVKSEPVRIAVARDEAFCFYYESSFEALRRAGAELVWFSPVREDHFPENVHGLYLGGGYPERYASALMRPLSLKMKTSSLPFVPRDPTGCRSWRSAGDFYICLRIWKAKMEGSIRWQACSRGMDFEQRDFVDSDMLNFEGIWTACFLKQGNGCLPILFITGMRRIPVQGFS